MLSGTLNHSQFLIIQYNYSVKEQEAISEINLSRHLTDRCPEAKREEVFSQGMHFVDGILNLGDFILNITTVACDSWFRKAFLCMVSCLAEFLASTL